MPHRRLNLLQSVSLNMSMMVGVGPFITIPLLLQSMNGPVSMIGWIIGALIAVTDGLVWSELSGAFPGSGGTYHYFDAVHGDSFAGRALKFLFVWQFLASGPLELASGLIGFAAYAGYLHPALKLPVWSLSGTILGAEFVWTVTRGQLLAMLVTYAIVAMAYRRIEAAGRLMVVLWLGMVATVVWIIAEGMSTFSPSLAFDIPPESLRFDSTFIFGLGNAVSLCMYAYFGYYQICWLGDEVLEPRKTIPRSILLSVGIVAAFYILMNLAVIGTLPWREAEKSTYVACDFLELSRGRVAANLTAILVLWTAVAACYAAFLGYSRVPYAAACSGHFFPSLAKLHPKGDFPHRSLLLMGVMTSFACLAELDLVIASLMTSRIVIQFIGQILTLFKLRSSPILRDRMTFRMPFFPLPALIALAGWLLVFATSKRAAILYGIGSLTLGAAAFIWWDRSERRILGDSASAK